MTEYVKSGKHGAMHNDHEAGCKCHGCAGLGFPSGDNVKSGTSPTDNNAQSATKSAYSTGFESYTPYECHADGVTGAVFKGGENVSSGPYSTKSTPGSDDFED